jgi:hypothetical protein
MAFKMWAPMTALAGLLVGSGSPSASASTPAQALTRTICLTFSRRSSRRSRTAWEWDYRSADR